MKPPEQVKLEFTQAWMGKAEGDFAAARHLLEGGPEYVFGAVFHAQQAAEKYIKAFLVWHQIEFSKTHDIKSLVELAALADAGIVEALENTEVLTPYGVEYRYPGDYPDVTLSAAHDAVRLAEQVRSAIRMRLPAQTLG